LHSVAEKKKKQKTKKQQTQQKTTKIILQIGAGLIKIEFNKGFIPPCSQFEKS
jgi:hypothetical protein